MKKLFVFLLIPLLSFGQEHDLESLRKQALKDASTTAKATLNSDFKTVLKYTHPNIIESSGGVDVLLPQIESMFKKMKKDGFLFKKAEVDYVSDIVKEQGEYRCYIRNLNEMTIEASTIKSTSYLLGFYLEDKKHWVFIEADKMASKQHKDLFFPDFKTSMDIPKDTVEYIN